MVGLRAARVGLDPVTRDAVVDGPLVGPLAGLVHRPHVGPLPRLLAGEALVERVGDEGELPSLSEFEVSDVAEFACVLVVVGVEHVEGAGSPRVHADGAGVEVVHFDGQVAGLALLAVREQLVGVPADGAAGHASSWFRMARIRAGSVMTVR